MCKDKKMFALIIAIFIMVLLITGWVFADRSVMDLITATPIFEAKSTVSIPAALTEDAAAPDAGICLAAEVCR